MAYKIIWYSKAIVTFYKVIHYLELNWTELVIKKFILLTEKTITILSHNPYLFTRSEK